MAGIHHRFFGRDSRERPKAGRRRQVDGNLVARGRRLDVVTVVDRTRLQRVAAGRLDRPDIGPRLAAGRLEPGLPAVDRNLDAGDETATRIGRGAGDRDVLAFFKSGARSRSGNCRNRRLQVGRGDGRDQPRFEVGWLHTHFGEHVDHRLTDVGIGRHLVGIVLGIEAEGPVNGRGAEDQSATRSTVHRQAVRHSLIIAGGQAVVAEVLVDRMRRRRKIDQSCRAVAVVNVGIPLVTK